MLLIYIFFNLQWWFSLFGEKDLKVDDKGGRYLCLMDDSKAKGMEGIMIPKLIIINRRRRQARRGQRL